MFPLNEIEKKGKKRKSQSMRNVNVLSRVIFYRTVQ